MFLLSHTPPQKMKPTVGLTHFFYLRNPCREKREAINADAGFELSKNHAIFWAMLNLFSLQTKRAFFLHLTLFFDSIFRNQFELPSQVLIQEKLSMRRKTISSF